MGRKRKNRSEGASTKKRKVQSDSEGEADEEATEEPRRRERGKRAQTEKFMVERPLEIISFKEIHELYFKHRDRRFADIFQSWNEHSEGQNVSVSQYFYYTKWEDCSADKSNFIQDYEFPEAAYRTEFRIFNGYPKYGEVLEVKAQPPPEDNYEPPQIIKTTREARSKPTKLKNFKISLYDGAYNRKFGMFPLTKMTYEKKEDWVYAADQTKRFIGYSEVADLSEEHEDSDMVAHHQKSNKEWLRLLIIHKNIVAMHDMFYWRSPVGQLRTVSVEEWCSQSLRDRIATEDNLDWKGVCKDILTAFSLIHGYGIHLGVSLDNIRFNKIKNCYQLTGFKNFRFGSETTNVTWESVEFAPRKFGISEQTLPFDFTVDLYALAICILHVKRKDLQFQDLTSLVEIENAIEESLTLFQHPENRFLRRMLRGRMWIHGGMEKQRLSAKSFLKQLKYVDDETYSQKECIYMHSMTGIFTNETLYFTSEENVNVVMNRLISPFYPEDTEHPEYVMLCSKDFSDSRTPSLVIPNEEDFEKAIELVENNSNQILIMPKLKAKSTEMVRKNSWFEIRCLYEQELGACPILITSNDILESKMKSFVKRNIVSKKYRSNCKVVLMQREGRRKEHDELNNEVYQIEIVQDDGSVIECENRLRNLKEFDERLEGTLLEMEDVAGKSGSERNSEDSNSDS